MEPHRVEPGPGQESVWDYPRPPAVVPGDQHVTVTVGDTVVADTHRPIRVLETSQPPAFYLPVADVATDLLVPTTQRTFCEWKGTASYFDVVVGDHVAHDAAWTYPAPVERFAALVDHLAFYAQRVDECTVNGEVVDANEGAFYGGWITSTVVGPFKGGPGTIGW